MVLVLILLLFNKTAYATVIGQLIRPYISYTMTADDNILRIRDRMDRQALLGTNDLFDFSHRFFSGAIIEKQFSKQRVHINGNWNRTWYDRFSRINNTGYDIRGNWNWFLGKNFSGNMGADFIRGQSPFLFQPGIKNIRTQHREYFDLTWHFHPSWQWHTDYAHFDFDTSNATLRFQNRREDRFGTGLDYLTANGNSFGLQYRHIRGKFTSPIVTPQGIFTENDYHQNEIKGKIDWKVTGKSHFKLLGGWVQRKNATFNASDFSGANVRLTYQWKPTSKVYLTFSGWRETVAVQSILSNFSLNTGTSTTAVWQLSAKTQVKGFFSYQTQKLDRFSIFANQSAAFNNKNEIISASLEFIYAPIYNVEISAVAMHNSLDSNSPLGGFNANGGTLSLRYIFGGP